MWIFALVDLSEAKRPSLMMVDLQSVLNKQESIPVGCVLPILYHMSGLCQRGLPDRDPRARPPGQKLLWTETPPPRNMGPGSQTPSDTIRVSSNRNGQKIGK